ncbi:hypothetical protein QTP70_009255 [Hemibagrus guttatus]|uniref:G-protein coupled receptors family 1 profile domain-containing protein n=1 Tax=Hemibagrus guttatus TaxID=175788 RepID=A0AAE0QII1_9TELE|nr:hypothetical protein QTP70_009255 [Hemibagrus guttatus]
MLCCSRTWPAHHHRIHEEFYIGSEGLYSFPKLIHATPMPHMATINITDSKPSFTYEQVYKVDFDATTVTKIAVAVLMSLFFVYINGIMLFALGITTIMYSMSLALANVARVFCSLLVLISTCTFQNAPLTLALMSLERYVAICFPLRHCTIATQKSTGIALAIVCLRSGLECFWGASPHDVASVGGAAPILASGGEFRQYLAPALPLLEEFQTPARRKSSPRSHRSSVDVARRKCSAVDVARRCCLAVDVAWPCCSAVDVTRLCCSAVDVARRLRSAVDVTLDPLALPLGPVLPPLVSLLLLTPPTCLALTLIPPTCLALVLASPHSPCFCFSLPPKCLALLLAPPTGLSTFLAPPQDPSLDWTFWGGLSNGKFFQWNRLACLGEPIHSHKDSSKPVRGREISDKILCQGCPLGFRVWGGIPGDMLHMATINITDSKPSFTYEQVYKVDFDATTVTKIAVAVLMPLFFVYINGIMLFALGITTIMYSMSLALANVARVFCSLLVLISNCTFQNAPLTLALMSLERYVAICFPLRHCTIATQKSTGIALAIVCDHPFHLCQHYDHSQLPHLQRLPRRHHTANPHAWSSRRNFLDPPTAVVVFSVNVIISSLTNLNSMEQTSRARMCQCVRRGVPAPHPTTALLLLWTTRPPNLMVPRTLLHVTVLIDSRAAVNLIDRGLVEEPHLSITSCTPPLRIMAVNNQPIGEGYLSHQTQPLELQLSNAQKTLLCTRPYKKLSEVFSKEKATHLPPHRPWDCAIELLPNAMPPKNRIYLLSLLESKAMEEYIEEALDTGYNLSLNLS